MSRFSSIRLLAIDRIPSYRRVLKATIVVGVMSGLVMAFTVLRDLSIAYRFGTGDVVDAFFMALLLPTLAVQITAVALASGTVPQFIRLRQEDPAKARALAANVGAIVAAVLVLTTVCLALAVGPILQVIGPGFSPEKAAVTRAFYLALLPSILLQGWSTFAGALVNAQERFAIVAVAPAMRPLLIIILLLFVPIDEPMVMAVGFLIGAVLEACIVGFLATRLAIPILPRWTGIDLSTRRILRESGMIAVGTMILSSAQFVDQYLAALLAPGSVAALSYGGKVVSVVIGFVALPLSVTLLPYFAGMAARQDWGKLRATLLDWSAGLLAIGIPIAAAFAYWSVPIVRLLFERGAFSATDTILVAHIQSYLLLQIPFYILGILWVRVLMALQRTWLVAIVALTNATINIAASLILIRTEGVAGIALGTSLGYVVASTLAGCITFYLLSRAIRKSEAIPSPPSPSQDAFAARSIFEHEDL